MATVRKHSIGRAPSRAGEPCGCRGVLGEWGGAHCHLGGGIWGYLQKFWLLTRALKIPKEHVEHVIMFWLIRGWLPVLNRLVKATEKFEKLSRLCFGFTTHWSSREERRQWELALSTSVKWVFLSFLAKQNPKLLVSVYHFMLFIRWLQGTRDMCCWDYENFGCKTWMINVEIV